MTAIATDTPIQARVVTHDRWLRVHFSKAEKDFADFHYIWLRHNCDHDRHPTTRERTLCSSEIAADIRPKFARIEGEPPVLNIAWANDSSDRVSAFSLEWLKSHAYALGRTDVAVPPGNTDPLEFDARESHPEELPRRVIQLVDQFGLAVIRNYGIDTETLIDSIAAAGLSIRGTHFGRIEDLRTDNTTNQNTDQLGYTNYPVNLHTDQPFIENPPRYQLLQSMRVADEGGENYVVDALQAARYLESVDRQAFELLTTVPVRFHRKQKAFESLHVGPILNFNNPDGFIIRYSYFTMAPHILPFELMEDWYRAYNRFANLVNDPNHQYHVALREGDFLMYKNWRMLHARNGFRGARWVRGIYFDPMA